MMKQSRNLAVLALAGWLLAGCAGFYPNNGMPSRADITPGEMITVKPGENIYALAKEHNVSMRDTIALNNLRPPYNLSPGQQIILPAKPGEAPSTYAPPPDAAPSGVVDRVPLTSLTTVPISGAGASASAEALKPVGTALPPIATPPAAPPQAPTSLVQSLNAPVPPPKPVVTTVTPAANSLAAAQNSVQASAQNTQAAAQTVAQNATTKLTTAVATAAAPVEAATTTSLIWPVQGQVVSGFGPKPQGLKNDGVNIAAPKGSPVVAAGNGIVVYAGDEMKGFGNLILIRHQGDLVTAYAHLDRMLVAKDAVVAQGDMIGTVGKTGDVPSPQLHFEVRRDGKPIDPNGVVKGQ